jgi:hypothetical protein
VAPPDNSCSRITPLTPHRIELPPVSESHESFGPVIKGDVLEWLPVRAARGLVRRSLADLHLRLAALNPSDDGQLLAWCREQGRLGLALDENGFTFKRRRVYFAPGALRRLWTERKRALDDPRHTLAETRLEYHCAVALMRDMLRVRRWATEHISPDDWSSPSWLWPRPRSLKAALVPTVNEMNDAIQVFAPRAEVIFPDDGEFPGYREIPLTQQSTWNLAMACVWNDLLQEENDDMLVASNR